MRQYPRMVHKGKTKKIVNNETEEINASQEGYESHWNPEIVEQRKGTDREILRTKVSEPEKEPEIPKKKRGRPKLNG